MKKTVQKTGGLIEYYSEITVLSLICDVEIKSSHIEYDYVKFVSRLSNFPYLIIVSTKI